MRIKVTAFLKFSISLILTGFAAILIFFMIRPFSGWYLNSTPAVGVDLYNSATYVAFHLKHFSLPLNGFKDIWFGGYPLALDFPQLSFFLMLPFGAYFGPHFGVQIFSMVVLFLLLFFCYLLYFHLAKNFGLALFLTAAVFLSVNLYGDLTWAGSIPYFTSQLFFPLGLLAAVCYFEKPERRRMATLILVTGLGILIHPLGVLAYLIPSALIIIFLKGLMQPHPISKILTHSSLYIVGFLLASFIFTSGYVVPILVSMQIPNIVSVPQTPATETTVSPEAAAGAKAIADFYKGQITSLYTQTNIWIFILVATGAIFFILTLPIRGDKKRLGLALPLILITIYAAAHPAVNLAGIVSIFRHDPYRAFWQFPVAVGALAAYFWGYGLSAVGLKLAQLKVLGKVTNYLLIFSTTLIFGVIAFAVYMGEVEKMIAQISAHSEVSSAFPEALNDNLRKENLEKITKSIIPSFIDPHDKNKRMYSADATINIWWNSFFDMPLVRGYLDPPIGTDRRGGFFWLDIAIANDSLTRDFKIPEDIALNNAKFLMDWYAVNYFEGGRPSSRGPNPGPSKYLLDNAMLDKVEEVTASGALLRWMTASGKPEWHPELTQTLKYFKVADEYASPILSLSDAPSVLVFSDWPGYEDFMRVLGAFNINSKNLVPVYGGKYIDDFDLKSLNRFEAVFLHNYDYRNRKVFDKFTDYVNRGGKIFVDTGGEVKDSKSDKLPEIFPMKDSVSGEMGKEWELGLFESPFIKEVELDSFGPLIFNQNPWKITTPKNKDLKAGSTVILTHKDKPILVERKIGQGDVVWSGFNAIYHYNQYRSRSEGKLLLNIVEELTRFKDVPSVIHTSVSWVKPEKVIASVDQKAGGILFKEQGYEGWQAKIISSGKALPIFKAGPTFPGFMYVPLDGVDFGSKVEFNFVGDYHNFIWAAINLITVLILLEMIFFKGKLVGDWLGLRAGKFRSKVFSWWEKEEEV